ncbi:ORF6N domain-containing protein [Fibrobacter sp. UWEL]|uniref:ORF6N domain-containing protein n=1 Tax=Fibrobacter sp. UWEL TaxID=1896209 RepID=UPI0009129772|nr:ORF6N domain-containing protein [Fibrobacter sp. UWEL]SHL00437.1 ORF6N domain-containing protein [Fibrobacter sp. UWEL]
MSKKLDIATESGSKVALIDENLLKSKVYTIRGVKVMLDADLAEIYGYTVKHRRTHRSKHPRNCSHTFRLRNTESRNSGE